jgi:hypothetical protein
MLPTIKKLFRSDADRCMDTPITAPMTPSPTTVDSRRDPGE